MNLIINARDAMPKAARSPSRPRITLPARTIPLPLPEGDYVVISVVDLGLRHLLRDAR